MHVEIFSIHAAFSDRKHTTWAGEAQIESPEDAFRYFNRVDEADVIRLDAMGYNLPSLSMGDYITLSRGDFHASRGDTYRVESIGFKRVNYNELLSLGE